MCGRYSFTQKPNPDQVILAPDQDHVLRPRYNLAPSQLGPIISQQEPAYIQYFRWGLVPHWAKDIKIGYKLINARAETLLDKPSFRQAARRSRCLVLADGFYEWKKVQGGKQPIRFVMQDDKPFYFAGLTEKWITPEGHPLYSFTIITTEPNELVANVHDRMPVILPKTAALDWINSALAAEELHASLRPYPAERMKAYPVSKAVGNVRNDFAELIEPVNG